MDDLPDDIGLRADTRFASASIAEHMALFSHDIRAAMSEVLGGLRLIDAEALDPDNRLQFDRVIAASADLAAMVDAALMAAAGETMIAADSPESAFEPWVQALEDRCRGIARDHGAAFEVRLSRPQPRAVRVSRTHLDRMIVNLIANAFHHGNGATVSLTVAPATGGALSLRVTDQGPGFPAAVLARHERGAPQRATGPTGRSGLGLRIARELAQQLGTELQLANAPDGGSVAEIILPAALVAWDGEAVATEALPDLSGLRLLVAEDNLTNQAILRNLLAQMRADAVFVGDGEAALVALDAGPFDLALIDIEMPRLDGIGVMRAVRARGDAVSEMPLLALTAYVLRDNREAIYAAGCDGIIGKPIASTAAFGRAIERMAGRASLPEPRGTSEITLSTDPSEPADPGLDRARFDALLHQAGAEGAVELLDRLLTDLCSVRDAMGTALDGGDLNTVREQTHILIALAGAVGADRLCRQAEVLNIAAKRGRAAELRGLYPPCQNDLAALIADVIDRQDAVG